MRKKGNLFGPFLLSEEQWEANRTDPRLNYQKADISQWKKQCALFALWTRKTHEALVLKNGQDPTSEDIYLAQWPGASIDGLDKAIKDTAELIPKGGS